MIRLTWVEDMPDDSERETVIWVGHIAACYTDANGKHHAHTTMGHLVVRETPDTMMESLRAHEEAYDQARARVWGDEMEEQLRAMTERLAVLESKVNT